MDGFARAQQLWDWIAALPNDFAFLLALPFVVAALGLLSEFRRTRRGPR